MLASTLPCAPAPRLSTSVLYIPEFQSSLPCYIPYSSRVLDRYLLFVTISCVPCSTVLYRLHPSLCTWFWPTALPSPDHYVQSPISWWGQVSPRWWALFWNVICYKLILFPFHHYQKKKKSAFTSFQGQLLESLKAVSLILSDTTSFSLPRVLIFQLFTLSFSLFLWDLSTLPSSMHWFPKLKGKEKHLLILLLAFDYCSVFSFLT